MFQYSTKDELLRKNTKLYHSFSQYHMIYIILSVLKHQKKKKSVILTGIIQSLSSLEIAAKQSKRNITQFLGKLRLSLFLDMLPHTLRGDTKNQKHLNGKSTKELRCHIFHTLRNTIAWCHQDKITIEKILPKDLTPIKYLCVWTIWPWLNSKAYNQKAFKTHVA